MAVKMWSPCDFFTRLKQTISDPNRFKPQYVNDRKYLSFYRLHARVCGLLAEVGIRTGYLSEFGRRFSIEPILGKGNRYQRQAEADVSYIDPESDKPIVLLDYETSDAPLSKMRGKFNYINTFAKYTNTISAIALFLTVTDVQHGWAPETREERKHFADTEIPEFANTFRAQPHNADVFFLAGTFTPSELRIQCFAPNTEIETIAISYANNET